MALELNISLLGGPLCTVNMAPTEPVLHVKLDLEQKTGIPCQDQQLFHNDLKLDEADVLGKLSCDCNCLELTLLRRVHFRDQEIYWARLSEQAERYDDMWRHLENAFKSSDDDPSVEERNLLAVALNHVRGSRRAAWRISTSIERKEKSKGNVGQATYARQLSAKIVSEYYSILDAVIDLLDHLISRGTTCETKIFYHKMKADNHRYVAEISDDDAKGEAIEKARLAYVEAMQAAEDDLAVTHPTRLGLALSYCVFQYEVLNNADEACKIARSTVAMLENLSTDSHKHLTHMMQLLRDNLTLWTSN